jgi:hypothetical protein
MERNSIKLLVFVLNREQCLDSILEAFVKPGITGATILDSEGMGHYLAYEVPIFAYFKELMALATQNCVHRINHYALSIFFEAHT